MKATVGIVCYNEEAKIRDLLVSLCAENNRNFLDKIIVVDNGSTDKTLERIQAFQKNSDVEIAIKSNPENILGQSRQIVVQACTSSLLLFVDADCIVPEYWAEALIRQFEHLKPNHPQLAGVCGPNRLPEDSRWKMGTNRFLDLPFGSGGSPQAKIPYGPEGTDHLPTTNALFDLEILRKSGGFNETLKFGEDSELGHRMKLLGFEMVLCPQPVVINRSADSVSEWVWRMMRFGQCQWLHARNRSLVFIFLLVALLTHFDLDEILKGSIFLLLVFGALIFTRAKESSLMAALMGMLTLASYVAGFIWGTLGFVKRFVKA